MKRILVVAAFFLVFMIILLLAIWFGVNSYVIPKIIIPQIKQQILDFNQSSPIKIYIKEIKFGLLQGLHCRGLKISNMISAEAADLNLDLFALLNKQIIIKNFEITDISIDIIRDSKGRWNIAPLLQLNAGDSSKKQKSPPFIVQNIAFNRCRVHFVDVFKKKNKLKRDFNDVRLLFSCVNGHYIVEIDGNDADKNEKLSIDADYYAQLNELKGVVVLSTPHLEEYWHYYLDEVFAPWKAKAKNLNAHIAFSIKNNVASVNGQSNINGANVAFRKIKFLGDATVAHQQTINLKNIKQIKIKTNIDIKNGTASVGKKTILKQADASALLTEKQISINRIAGISENRGKLDLSGKYVFSTPRLLEVKGLIDDTYNDFSLILARNNEAQLSWFMTSEAMELKLDGDLQDIKNLIFDANIAGSFDLARMPSNISIDMKGDEISVETYGNDFAGNMKMAGRLKGKLDDFNSLNGLLGMKFENFSIFKFPSVSFELGMRVQDGWFGAAIPAMKYFNGTLSGEVTADQKHWGVHLVAAGCDISQLVTINSALKGLKGIMSGNIALVCSYESIDSLRGGGYLKVMDCDFGQAPIFDEITKSIKSVSHGFIMPNFKKVVCNFDIKGLDVMIDNAICEADALTLLLNGKYNYGGNIDMTVGVKFFKKGFWNTLRIVLLPETLGFDIMADSIKVNVTGAWPNINATSGIQPMAWFERAFGSEVKHDPNRYQLENLW